MPSVNIDQSQVTFEEVSCTDTDGEDIEGPAFIVPVVIPEDQIAAWEAAYDPASSSSPSAANSRIIARAVLDAIAGKAPTEAT